MQSMTTSCTIIIFNYESLPFLRACVKQIIKYKHPKINHKIIISEQSCEDTYNKVVMEFGNNDDITIVRMKAICSGYAIDYIIRFVDLKTEYICCLDCDAFPINKNWLYAPIKLIQENNFSFVGHHADEGRVSGWKSFEDAYSKYGNYFHVAQCFRVGKKEDFEHLSLNAGFTKAVNFRDWIEFKAFPNKEWFEVAKERGLDGYADSGVIAHWWEDRTTRNNKFTFAETACLGIAPKQGRYGRVFDNMVFHLMFSFNHTQLGGAKEENMGNDYMKWIEKINNGFTDELINEMLKAVNPINIPRLFWDGKTISLPSEKLNNRINELINA